MRCLFLTRIGLPVCVLLAALLLLPGASSAQRWSQRESLPLSAAIEEAKRSPFHVRDGVSGSVAPGTEPTAHFLWSGANSLVAGQETGEGMPVDGPPTGKVFLATAIAAPVANAVGFALVWRGFWADADGESVWDDIAFLGGGAIALLGPPIAARLVGGHFGRALLGSGLGTALGIMTLSMVGEDRNETTWLLSFSLYSLIHAGMTTFMEQLGRKARAGAR